jgi:hypothetical protein
MAAVPLKPPDVPVDVPVILTVEVPSGAELVALKVSVLVALALAGLNDAVTPAGSPDAARATAPWKPPCRAMVMVLALELPGARLRLEGAAVRVKAWVAVIVSANRAVLVNAPEVPVIVTVADAAAAELVATSVRVLAVSVLVGLNDAVTPAGNPDTERLTALLKPCCGLTVMVLVPLVPAAMESAETDEDRLKAGELEDVPARLLINWPEGLPHPVARS